MDHGQPHKVMMKDHGEAGDGMFGQARGKRGLPLSWGFRPWFLRITTVLSIGIALFFLGLLPWLGRDRDPRLPFLGRVSFRMSNEFSLWSMGRSLAQWGAYVEKMGMSRRPGRDALATMATIDLRDPRTLLGHGLPGFSLFDGEIDVASKDIDYSSLPIPIEHPPPQEIEEAIRAEMKRKRSTPLVQEPASRQKLHKEVLIYHTHFWESYLPELKRTDPEKANDLHNNVTRIGNYLASQLEEVGVGALVAQQTYPWKGAYNSSRKLIKEVWQRYGNIPYLIDIHRDSSRAKTDTVCNGQTYARLAFIVGRSHANFTQNLQLARDLHHRLNSFCEGLSKAVVVKVRGGNTHGEYNQSLSPHSILLEVGGVENSFQEGYRSMEVLSRVLQEQIQEGLLDSLPREIFSP